MYIAEPNAIICIFFVRMEWQASLVNESRIGIVKWDYLHLLIVASKSLVTIAIHIQLLNIIGTRKMYLKFC